jgi:hypothetical protein
MAATSLLFGLYSQNKNKSKDIVVHPANIRISASVVTAELMKR